MSLKCCQHAQSFATLQPPEGDNNPEASAEPEDSDLDGFGCLLTSLELEALKKYFASQMALATQTAQSLGISVEYLESLGNGHVKGT